MLGGGSGGGGGGSRAGRRVKGRCHVGKSGGGREKAPPLLRGGGGTSETGPWRAGAAGACRAAVWGRGPVGPGPLCPWGGVPKAPGTQSKCSKLYKMWPAPSLGAPGSSRGLVGVPLLVARGGAVGAGPPPPPPRAAQGARHRWPLWKAGPVAFWFSLLPP